MLLLDWLLWTLCPCGLHSSRGFVVSLVVAVLIFSALSDCVICVLVLLVFLLLRVLLFLACVVIAVVVAVVAVYDVPVVATAVSAWWCFALLSSFSMLPLQLWSFDYCGRQCKKKLDTAVLTDFWGRHSSESCSIQRTTLWTCAAHGWKKVICTVYIYIHACMCVCVCVLWH